MIKPGESWTYRSAPKEMKNPGQRWSALDWNPMVQFAHDDDQNFCSQRWVPSYHRVE